MFSAKIKQPFLFQYKDFFLMILSFMLLGVFIFIRFNGLSMWNILWTIPVLAVIMKFFLTFLNPFFYFDRKQFGFEHAKFDKSGNFIPETCGMIEYLKCDGSTVRFNKDGSYHNQHFPTFEKDNTKYYWYNKKFFKCDNSEMMKNVARIQEF